jgi:hypothetical protein
VSSADVDEFLARADDVLADWRGSDDAAAWAADGSHEHDIAPYAYLNSFAEYEWAAMYRRWAIEWAATFITIEYTVTRVWFDESVWSAATVPAQDESTVETYAGRWLETPRPGASGSLEPIAGCPPELTPRNTGLRVRSMPALPRRAPVAPTTGPQRPHPFGPSGLRPTRR